MHTHISSQELDILREQGIEKATLVRVTSDMAESKRRKEEDRAKLERYVCACPPFVCVPCIWIALSLPVCLSVSISLSYLLDSVSVSITPCW